MCRDQNTGSKINCAQQYNQISRKKILDPRRDNELKIQDSRNPLTKPCLWSKIFLIPKNEEAGSTESNSKTNWKTEIQNAHTMKAVITLEQELWTSIWMEEEFNPHTCREKCPLSFSCITRLKAADCTGFKQIYIFPENFLTLTPTTGDM